MNDTYDVAVLGAGIAGSSLAKRLADQGYETVLIDRMQFPRHKVCGEFLSPESSSMLDALGLRGLVESIQPSVMNQARLFTNNGELLEIPLPGTAFGISRYALDAALHDAAQHAGVHVHTSTTVTSVSPDGRGYTIETKQGAERKTYHVRAAIAAWGANARSGLPGRRPEEGRIPHTAAHIGVKSHYTGVDMEPAVELYFLDGGYVGVSPVENGHFNVAALLKRNAFPNSAMSVPQWIEEAARRNPKLHRKLANAVAVPGTQAAVAPVNVNRKPHAWEMLPRVGDAALLIPPLCGDGMSMALRSALLCAPFAEQYLRGEISLADWQHGYSQAIRREFKGPMQWGRLLQWLLGGTVFPHLLLRAAHFAPGLAYRIVQATRLKDIDSFSNRQ